MRVCVVQVFLQCVKAAVAVGFTGLIQPVSTQDPHKDLSKHLTHSYTHTGALDDRRTGIIINLPLGIFSVSVNYYLLVTVNDKVAHINTANTYVQITKMCGKRYIGLSFVVSSRTLYARSGCHCTMRVSCFGLNQILTTDQYGINLLLPQEQR